MRELVFTLEHEPGCNRVADALAEYPGARIRSLSLHATAESLCRVDHVTGPAAALADIEDAFLATNHYTDCITSEYCDASQRTQVLEPTKQEREYTWRIVHSGDGDVRTFFDELEETVADCVTIDFQRLSDASSPVTTTSEPGDLSSKQEETLQAAVEHGYYENPGEIDVKGLSELLDVPRSTLNHRLRRAEEHLAKQRVSEMASRQQPPTSD